MSKRARWAVPGGVAVLVAAGLVIPAALANATPDLPDRTAQELVADVLEAQPVALQGTVSWTADLGLPELPDLNNATSASPLSLLYGTSTVDVWYDGAQGARAAMKAATSQYTTVTNGAEAWAYSSADNTAVHVTNLPAHDAASWDHATMPDGTALPSPQELAAQLLQAADPSTALSVEKPVKVAGQDCYQLVATPKDDATVIGSVRVAIDASTSLPLRVEVWAKGATKAAINTGFTSITYTTPDPALFSYQAPAGAEVTTVDASDESAFDHSQHPGADAAAPDDSEVTTSGTGWATVVIADMGEQAGAMLSAAGGVDALLGQLAAPGGQTDGDLAATSSSVASLLGQMMQTTSQGTAFSTPLGSALVTDDGRVLAGAVSVDTLVSTAQATAK